MSGCSQTNTPVLEPTSDFCKGIHTSTACIFPKEAITYLGIQVDETLQQALVKVANAIQTSNQRIAALESENLSQGVLIQELTQSLTDCCGQI